MKASRTLLLLLPVTVTLLVVVAGLWFSENSLQNEEWITEEVEEPLPVFAPPVPEAEPPLPAPLPPMVSKPRIIPDPVAVPVAPVVSAPVVVYGIPQAPASDPVPTVVYEIPARPASVPAPAAKAPAMPEPIVVIEAPPAAAPPPAQPPEENGESMLFNIEVLSGTPFD